MATKRSEKYLQLRPAAVLLVLLLAISLTWTRSLAVVQGDVDINQISFRQWKAEYGRVYKDVVEEMRRHTVFEENRKIINDWNVKAVESGNAMLALNKFADMTPAEFKQKVLMPPRQPLAFHEERYAPEIRPTNIPNSFDWREQGKVTDVKDQGSAGTCWAFSTIGNIEGQWAMKGKTLISLSTELLVDCDDMKDPANRRADCGVFGGWPYLAYQYIEKIGGMESEATYPYCSGNGKCFPCQAKGYNKTLCGPPVEYCNKTQSCAAKLNRNDFVPGLQVKGWQAISKNETEMAAQLVRIGPLSIAINAELLQFYHHGVWHPPHSLCNPASLDHAILLVGYGVEKGFFGDKPYWLIKNSWGTKWGEDGYFRMFRGDGQCGVNSQVTTALLN